MRNVTMEKAFLVPARGRRENHMKEREKGELLRCG